MKTPILKMTNIIKEFPGVKALDGVNLELYEGKVMALMGENGAGKSTLMKILSGVYKKDGGQIFYNGVEEDIKGPKDATKKGIAIIHQELNLIKDLSIGENIFLGREFKKGFRVDFNKLHEEGDKLLKKLNVNRSSRDLVEKLSLGEQQMVEIAKALSLDAKIIIMDEPTDALTETETQSLFKVIEELKSEKENYEKLLKEQNNNDIEDVVSYLNGTLETFLDTLNVEFKGKNAWFDYNNIEFRFAASRAGSTLSSIGSGSNHAQYHIAMAMILQIFIQNKVKNKCTFDFVVFDQPSEIYFPTTDDGKRYSNVEHGKENDVESLHMLFSTIAKTQKSSCPNLQIIVLEHAGEEYWKDRSNNFYTNNIKIINWKNTGEKLIPKNWKDE